MPEEEFNQYAAMPIMEKQVFAFESKLPPDTVEGMQEELAKLVALRASLERKANAASRKHADIAAHTVAQREKESGEVWDDVRREEEVQKAMQQLHEKHHSSHSPEIAAAVAAAKDLDPNMTEDELAAVAEAKRKELHEKHHSSHSPKIKAAVAAAKNLDPHMTEDELAAVAEAKRKELRDKKSNAQKSHARSFRAYHTSDKKGAAERTFISARHAADEIPVSKSTITRALGLGSTTNTGWSFVYI